MAIKITGSALKSTGSVGLVETQVFFRPYVLIDILEFSLSLYHTQAA